MQHRENAGMRWNSDPGIKGFKSGLACRYLFLFFLFFKLFPNWNFLWARIKLSRNADIGQISHLWMGNSFTRDAITEDSESAFRQNRGG
jgi:hypothetical protein